MTLDDEEPDLRTQAPGATAACVKSGGGAAQATILSAMEQRGAFVSAAWVVLARGGWWGLKVESVLRESGFSARCFYHHFANKNDLIRVLLEEEVHRAAEWLATAARGHSDPIAGARAWISAMFRSVTAERSAARARFFLSQWREIEAEYPKSTSRCLERFLAPLVTIIEEGRATGVFPDANPQSAALAIHHITSGALSNLPGSWLNEEQAELVITTFALRALTHPGDLI